MILNILYYIIMGLSNALPHIYIASFVLGEKIDYKNLKFYICWIVLSIVLLLNFFFISGFVRVIIVILSLFVIYKILFNKNNIFLFILSFFTEIIMMISELIYLVGLTVITTTNVNSLVAFYSGTLVTNIIISIISVLVGCNKVSKALFNKIAIKRHEIDAFKFVIIMSVLLITINIIFGYFYKSVNLVYIIIVNILISFVYFFICFRFLKTENKYFTINSKYNNTLNSLKEYEDILDAYRVSNHENKNQLLMIRNMIVKNEKGIPEYIDKIIDNKIKDDEKLMFDTNKIPAGGLRAVIYSKLLIMKEEKIDFKLVVDRKVHAVDLIELGEDLMLDVCRVTGVFLDNAIEEVKNKENKKIIVELFTDDDLLCIKISNSFSGEINIERIYDKGYTTKTNGHGYGLTLVKEIIDNNRKLTNVTSIENAIFTQVLKIKLK